METYSRPNQNLEDDNTSPDTEQFREEGKTHLPAFNGGKIDVFSTRRTAGTAVYP